MSLGDCPLAVTLATPTNREEVWIDSTHYPEIIDNIIALTADRQVIENFRLVSTHCCEVVEDVYASRLAHVVLIFYTTPNIPRPGEPQLLPFACHEERTHLRDILRGYTPDGRYAGLSLVCGPGLDSPCCTVDVALQNIPRLIHRWDKVQVMDACYLPPKLIPLLFKSEFECLSWRTYRFWFEDSHWKPCWPHFDLPNLVIFCAQNALGFLGYNSGIGLYRRVVVNYRSVEDGELVEYEGPSGKLTLIHIIQRSSTKNPLVLNFTKWDMTSLLSPEQTTKFIHLLAWFVVSQGFGPLILVDFHKLARLFTFDNREAYLHEAEPPTDLPLEPTPYEFSRDVFTSLVAQVDVEPEGDILTMQLGLFHYLGITSFSVEDFMRKTFTLLSAEQYAASMSRQQWLEETTEFTEISSCKSSLLPSNALNSYDRW